MDRIAEFEKQIGIDFKDKEVLKTVFIHRSYINEHRSLGLEHNERLEFLGDAVLELVVTDHLYRKYKDNEGVLTTYRSALVKGEHLAKISKDIGLDACLVMSRGEEKSGGRDKGYLLANAFEALIGAIYLDQGYKAAEDFIKEHVLPRLEDIISSKTFIDPKTNLQEITQGMWNVTPEYRLVNETGPDHAKIFTMEVWAGEQKLAEGQGNSKQNAQMQAAENALSTIESAKN